MENKKGAFIVLEGINGCGKGTQFKLLHNYILGLGKAVPIFSTGEPNNFDDNGKKAREMLGKDGNPYDNSIEAVGYFAENRYTHNQIFRPLLNKGVNVISDRYWHSNFAFQHAQGIAYEKIAQANKKREIIAPDLTIILDIDSTEAMNRLGKRDGENRRKFDSNTEFLEKVRNNYLELPLILPKLVEDYGIVIVDGRLNPEKTFEKIKSIYDSFFGKTNLENKTL